MNILERSRAAVRPRENQPRFHVPVLDGVRGLALLVVLLIHLNGQVQCRFLNRSSADPLTFILLRVSNYGWVGVDVFFVLSVTRLLSVTPLRVLGKYSYGMYVLHVPMVPILYLTLKRLLRLGNFEVRPELAKLTLFPIFGIACVYLAAVLSFHLFERPFLRLKVRFNYSDRSAPAADSIVVSC